MGHRIDMNTIPQKQVLFRIMPGIDFAHIVKKLFYIFKKDFPENLNNFAIFYVTLL